MAKFKIGKKDYEFKFDYLAIRKFGKIVGLKRPAELETFFSNMDLQSPTFDDIDNIVHLLRSAIKHVKVPPFEEVLGAVMEDPEGLSKIFEEFMDSSEVEVTKDEETEGN